MLEPPSAARERSRRGPRAVQILADDLANKIAAGEVVERPASVVKELCENALDADATRIDVIIEGGGVALLRVVDDGFGMDPNDLALSLTRHATSKIATIEDLLAIESFGFRGEALPSIASVSRFTIASRPRGADEGRAIVIDEGARREEPRGMQAGTSVEVKDLFYNVPARRKFLRALATEAAHVTEVVDAVALARPDVTVTLERDGRRVREHLRASSREERVKSILVGWELATCTARPGPMKVEAYLSRPEKARIGATGLSVFVNDRPVRDRALSRAIAHAYGSVLPPGRFPVGVVYLDLPSDLVDVNVHPQKAEVRFADGRAVQDALYRVVQSGLGLAFTSQLGLEGSPAPSPERAPARNEEARAVFTGSGELPRRPLLVPEPIPYPTRDADPAPALPVDRDPPSEQSVPRGIRFVAQVRGTYWICESEDGLIILDQHAAAERVTFDKLQKAFRERAIAMQGLLTPEVIDVRPEDVELVESNADAILAMGMDLRPAGPARVAIHAIPQVLARGQPRELAGELLAELSKSAGRSFSRAIDLVLATMACHGSIRAGDRVSPEEAAELLARLPTIDFAGHCPHGRPILMRLPFRELDHRVGRR